MEKLDFLKRSPIADDPPKPKQDGNDGDIVTKPDGMESVDIDKPE